LVDRSGWETGLRFKGHGFRFPVSGFRFPVSGFRFPVSGFRFPVSGKFNNTIIPPASIDLIVNAAFDC